MPGRRSAAYWQEMEEYWSGYLRAYDRYMKAPQNSLEQRRARAVMRRELSLRLALEEGLRDL